MSDTSRLFFALWPDDETRQTVAGLCKSIKTDRFKWVRPHNLHVTLVFLGQVDGNTTLAIKRCASHIKAESFELTFDRLTYWSKPKILCLTGPIQEPASNGPSKLVEALKTAAADCGVQTDPRPYTPHITLARHARNLPNVKIEPIVWRAETFSLVESCSEPDGVNYKIMQSWPLLKPDLILG